MIKQERLQKLADELKKRGLDAIYIGPSPDLEYIGGLYTQPDERVRGLMVNADGKCFALMPLLYKEEMVKALKDVPYYVEWNDHEGFQGAFADGCAELGLKNAKIAFNDGVRAVDMLAMQEAVPMSAQNGADVLAPLRSVKDAEELGYMREASAIADRVVDKLRHFIKPGMKERDIAKAIPGFFEECGSDDISFDAIVACGPNGSMPHYSGGTREVAERDMVLLDLGGRYKGYCSDITRMLFVGEPTEEQKKIYEIVRRAQAAGEAAVQPGVTGQDVDRAGRKVIADAGYGEYFVTRLGHGIGVAVHESPFIIEGNDVPLKPGNVFSIEPGIYLPGKFGIRIENLVFVKEDGTAEALNKFPREITQVIL